MRLRLKLNTPINKSYEILVLENSFSLGRNFLFPVPRSSVFCLTPGGKLRIPVLQPPEDLINECVVKTSGSMDIFALFYTKGSITDCDYGSIK